MVEEQPRDSDEDRLRFILEGQAHCDHFLSPLADPRGKSVLVVGAGAGTEMLWCLRRGVREVVGIDILEQRPAALAQAVRDLGVEPAPPFSFLRLGIEEARTLGRRFDLVLSNNVFEHLPDLRRALEVCADLVEPGTGRIAIFTAPLFYSSGGSHLPAEPWEHLWQAPEALRQEVLGALPPRHALRDLDLADYLFREISLNRMRLPDLLEAVRANDLVVLGLRVLPDRWLRDLPGFLRRLEAVRREEGISLTDLALEGVGLELMRAGGSAFEETLSTEETLLARQRSEFGERVLALEARIRELDMALLQSRAEIDRLRAEGTAAREEALRHQRRAAEVKRVLDSVEASRSFRLGRFLTAPGRWVRRSRGA